MVGARQEGELLDAQGHDKEWGLGCWTCTIGHMLKHLLVSSLYAVDPAPATAVRLHSLPCHAAATIDNSSLAGPNSEWGGRCQGSAPSRCFYTDGLSQPWMVWSFAPFGAASLLKALRM
jgi:hypothetical protein